MNAEGAADAKRLQLALRIVGPDPEFLALPIERRDDLAIGEMCVAEVTEHTGIGGRRHCRPVIAALPVVIFAGMAACAFFRTDVRRRRLRTRTDRKSKRLNSSH